MEKVKKFLFEFDFLWSLPVAFLGFVLFPIVGQAVFGDGFGFYPPEFFHAGVYAGLIGVLFFSFTQMGIYFHFPELYKFYLGEGFKELPTWQKSIIFLSVFVFYLVVLLTIWATIV